MADWPNHAPTFPWCAGPDRARPVFAACKIVPDLSAQKGNAPSARAPCFDTIEPGQLSPPAVRSGRPPPCAVRLSWRAVWKRAADLRKSKPASLVRDRLRYHRAAFANAIGKTPD